MFLWQTQSLIAHVPRRPIRFHSLGIFSTNPEERLLFLLDQRAGATAQRCAEVTTEVAFNAVLCAYGTSIDALQNALPPSHAHQEPVQSALATASARESDHKGL